LLKADKDTEAGVLPSDIRQVYEADDFGEAFAPELREQEERQRAQLS
jgi:hypothetical protein